MYHWDVKKIYQKIDLNCMKLMKKYQAKTLENQEDRLNKTKNHYILKC